MERDRAYQLILSLILDGKIDKNTPLSERKLSNSLGIGRTPVREAIRDLSHDGVLESRPARGTFVKELTFEDVKEIFEIRYALEGMASFLAAGRGISETLKAYGPKFNSILESADNFEPSYEYAVGAEFHLEIFRAAGNKNLLQMYKPLRIRFRTALGLPQHYDHNRVRESVSEHLSILDAIEASDGASAQQRMCDHLAKGLEARMQIYQTLNQYAPPVHVEGLFSLNRMGIDPQVSTGWQKHLGLKDSMK